MDSLNWRSKLAARKIELNIVSKDDHVGYIEIYISITRKITRATYNSLLYTSRGLQTMMIVEMFRVLIYWLNIFLQADDVYSVMGGIQIVIGHVPNYATRCLQFLTYYQVHNNGKNNMSVWSSCTLVLRPMDNFQWCYYYYGLNVGHCIIWRSWIVLSTPTEVIT